MRLLRLLILWLPLAANAQPFTVEDPAFASQNSVAQVPWTPLSLPNLAAWWKVQGGFWTNGAVLTLNDLGPNGWHLLNVRAQAFWPWRVPSDPTIDGYDSVYFNGTDYHVLISTNYTNTQPYETWHVVRFDTLSYLQSCFGSGAAGRADIVPVSANTYAYAGASGGNVTTPVTNKWVVVTGVFASSQSLVLTNNIPGTIGNSSTHNAGGFTLAGRFTEGNVTKGNWVEVIACTSTNSAATRQTIFNYLTNRYPTIHSNLWGL